jgi:hypothetical protein
VLHLQAIELHLVEPIDAFASVVCARQRELQTFKSSSPSRRSIAMCRILREFQLHFSAAKGIPRATNCRTNNCRTNSRLSHGPCKQRALETAISMARDDSRSKVSPFWVSQMRYELPPNSGPRSTKLRSASTPIKYDTVDLSRLV